MLARYTFVWSCTKTYAVNTESGHTCLSTNRRNLLNNTTFGWLFSHGRHSLSGNIDKAKKIDCHCQQCFKKQVRILSPSIWVRICLSERDSNSPLRPYPALLQTTSMRPNFLIAAANALPIDSFDVTSKSWARKFLSLVPSNLSPLLLRAVATTWSPFCRITYSTLTYYRHCIPQRKEFTFNIFLAKASRSSSDEKDAWRHFGEVLVTAVVQKKCFPGGPTCNFPPLYASMQSCIKVKSWNRKVSGRWWCQISPWGAVVVCYGREVVGTNAT